MPGQVRTDAGTERSVSVDERRWNRAVAGLDARYPAQKATLDGVIDRPVRDPKQEATIPRCVRVRCVGLRWDGEALMAEAGRTHPRSHPGDRTRNQPDAKKPTPEDWLFCFV